MRSTSLALTLAACTLGCGLLAKGLTRPVSVNVPLHTIENPAYAIPPGTYELGLHRWSKSGKLVPILRNVPATAEYPSMTGDTTGYRTYILIHNGTRPEQSKGCILLPPAKTTKKGQSPNGSFDPVDQLVQLIQTYEKVTITIAPPDSL